MSDEYLDELLRRADGDAEERDAVRAERDEALARLDRAERNSARAYELAKRVAKERDQADATIFDAIVRLRGHAYTSRLDGDGGLAAATMRELDRAAKEAESARADERAKVVARLRARQTSEQVMHDRHAAEPEPNEWTRRRIDETRATVAVLRDEADAIERGEHEVQP